MPRVLSSGARQASPVGNRINNPDSHSHNNEALNNSSIAALIDIREPRHEGPEGHDDRHGAHHDYKNRTREHVRERQTIGRGTDRESCNRSLHHREQVLAPRARSIARQPLEGFFVRSWSISVRCVSPTQPGVMGLTNFQFLDGDLKRVDLNASRMGSSATVYFELPDLLPLPDCHVRTTIMNEPRRLDSFVSVFQSERIHKDS